MTEYMFKHDKGEVIATYTKGGKLKKLIAKRGFILPGMLVMAIPHLEEDINDELLMPCTPEKDLFFLPAQKAWFEFYKEYAGLDYRFQAKDGKALKEIGRHLINVTGSTAEALDVWRYTLNGWKRLDAFYRNNMDLVFINSQLNKILNLLKNGQQTGTAAKANNADGLRGRFTS